MSTRFSMSFNSRDNDSGDDIENIDMSFENPKSSAEVAKMIQKFLVAAGYANIEVVVMTARDEEAWQDPQGLWWDEQEPDFAPTAVRIPRFLRKDANEVESGSC